MCKIKHFYNIFTSMAQLREVDGSKTFLKMFYQAARSGSSGRPYVSPVMFLLFAGLPPSSLGRSP